MMFGVTCTRCEGAGQVEFSEEAPMVVCSLCGGDGVSFAAIESKGEVDFYAVWEKAMAKLAKGMDFSDSDDRAIFRMKVDAATNLLRVSAIQDLALHFGAKKKPSHTYGRAVRALANAYMGFEE